MAICTICQNVFTKKKLGDLNIVTNYRNDADFSILVFAIKLLFEHLPDDLYLLLDLFET